MAKVKFRSVSTVIETRLNSISARTGKTKTNIVKTGLLKILEERPEYLKEKFQGKNKHVLHVDGISPKTERELMNIAKNLNIPFNSFLKACLYDIIKEYPEEVQNFTPFEEMG